MQQPPQVDVRADVGRLGLQGALVGLAGALGACPLQVASPLEPVFGARAGVASCDHAERASGQIAFEIENVLPGIRAPAASTFLHDDAIAQSLDRQARQRHRIREMAAELFQ